MENTVSDIKGSNFSIHFINNWMERLLLKIHNITGLKYLCYSTKENFNEYLGSGKAWKRHIKKYGKNISTEVLFETENKQELIEKAKYFSNLFDVVNNKEFANLVPENGDGGPTTQIYRWVNNGIVNKYILKTDEIPLGFKVGRICKFSDPSFQKQMSEKAQIAKSKWTPEQWKENGKKISKAKKGKPNINWKGDKNPIHKNEVKEKMIKSLKLLWTEEKKNAQSEKRKKYFENAEKKLCAYCNNFFFSCHYTRSHGEKCKKKPT